MVNSGWKHPRFIWRLSICMIQHNVRLKMSNSAVDVLSRKKTKQITDILWVFIFLGPNMYHKTQPKWMEWVAHTSVILNIIIKTFFVVLKDCKAFWQLQCLFTLNSIAEYYVDVLDRHIIHRCACLLRLAKKRNKTMKKKGGYRTVHLSLMWCSGLQTFCKSQCPHCCQTACRWPCMLAVFGKETPCRWPCMLAVFGKETPCRWPCMLAVFGKEEAKDNGKKRCWWGRG